MRIENKDPRLLVRQEIRDNRAVTAQQEAPEGSQSLSDSVHLGKRNLDPGNTPLPLRAGYAGNISSGEPSAKPAFDDDLPFSPFPSGFSSGSLSSINLSSLNESLSQEVLDKIARDHKKWETHTFVYDTREAPKLDKIQLIGSFQPATGEYDKEWNQGSGVLMHDEGKNGDVKAGDGLYTAQVLFDSEDQHEFQWGVKADVFDDKGKMLSRDRWIMMTEEPPKFRAGSNDTNHTYAPLSNHLMGVHRNGDDGISFRTWSPEVGKGDLAGYKLNVDIYNDEGQLKKSLPMVKDEKTGNWSVELSEGWKDLENSSYEYSVRNSKGEIMKAKAGGKEMPVVYSDPYSRYLEGQQRGLERIYVDAILGIETGWYDDSGKGAPNYTINPQWGRFSVDDHPDAERVALVLKDKDGHQLTKKELLDRLGSPDLKTFDNASPAEKRNAGILQSWKLDTSGKVTAYKWTDGVHEDGTIDMKKLTAPGGETSWMTTVNNFPALVGLKYEFQAYEKGKLVGDINNDGKLQDNERKLTPFNDQYGNTISARPGAERRSLIKESSYTFKNDDMPRKETDYRKYVIYEAHVGSFMTTKDSAHAGNFEDLINHLDYVEKLGANTIELLPFNEFGGKRDWGYTPDFYFAGAEAYGFEVPREKALELGVIRKDQEKDKESVWIHGIDAVKLFVDEAHKRGFNVMSDVVYNHTSGKADGDNPLYMIDGDKQSFFKWYGDHNSYTDWGAKPNFSSQAVKDFYANNAAQQVNELHLDGIRFDFVQVIHNTGDSGEKQHGVNTLRQINRSLQFIRPETFSYTAAEDFSENYLTAEPLEKNQGMGFSSVWNGPFHHSLLGAIEGSNPDKNMDNLMNAIINHVGVSSTDKAVVFSHSHDEVGNSGTWAGRAAAHSRDDNDVMKPYPRNVAKSAAAVTLMSSGIPMIFQGEEFMANNDFKHGATSTWGADMSWLSFQLTPDRLDDFKRLASLPDSEKTREASKLSKNERTLFERYTGMSAEEKGKAEKLSDQAGIFECYKDLITLRGSSPAFAAGTPINRIFTHNYDRVMAYERKGGNDDYILITNFADCDRSGYRMDLPAGNWKEVFNTNAREYGGTGMGNGGGIVGQGVTLPAGATIILKKV